MFSPWPASFFFLVSAQLLELAAFPLPSPFPARRPAPLLFLAQPSSSPGPLPRLTLLLFSPARGLFWPAQLPSLPPFRGQLRRARCVAEFPRGHFGHSPAHFRRSLPSPSLRSWPHVVRRPHTLRFPSSRCDEGPTRQRCRPLPFPSSSRPFPFSPPPMAHAQTASHRRCLSHKASTKISPECPAPFPSTPQHPRPIKPLSSHLL